VLWDETHQRIFNEHLEMVLFELPKFSLLEPLEVPAKRERWLYFLKETNAMTSELLEQWKTPEIEEAVRELERLGRDPEWRMMYMDREKALRDYLSLIVERYEEGREKGREEGFEEGIEKGIEKGREEEKQEMAVRLMEMGSGVEQIVKVTGLSAEAIAALQARGVGEPSGTKKEG
jgi:predicted transposase/invertase (TIGR01784 family)